MKTSDVPLSDKELLDWLSQKVYVEATSSGAEDPDRFEYNRAIEQVSLRVALTRHVRKEPRDKTPGFRSVRLDDL